MSLLGFRKDVDIGKESYSYFDVCSLCGIMCSHIFFGPKNSYILWMTVICLAFFFLAILQFPQHGVTPPHRFTIKIHISVALLPQV